MRIFYLRDKHNRPVTTVASDLVKEPSGQPLVLYAVATWNPVDVLKKQSGKEEALMRLYSRKLAGHIHVTEKTHRQLKRLVILQIASNSELPMRTRKAAERWLATHTEPGWVQNIIAHIEEYDPHAADEPGE